MIDYLLSSLIFAGVFLLCSLITILGIALAHTPSKHKNDRREKKRMGKIADISKYQGNVDWAKARKELDFVILRASCGLSIDSKYLDNAEVCGLPFGVYHYVKAGTTEAARTEAQFFVKCVKQGHVQPCFFIADIEYKTQTEKTTEAVCVAFLDELRTLGCDKIGLYINTRYKWAGRAIAMCDIVWIPHYGKNTGDIPGDQYKPKHPYDLWQYTSKGTLAGVSGDVDLNVLSGAKPLEFFTRKDGEVPMTYYDPKKVIDIALAEVGYMEKASNSQLDDKTANAGNNNRTKYARDLDALGFYNGRKQGASWCDVYVDWCFVQAYGLEAALELTCQPLGRSNCGAGCKYSRRYYAQKGRLYDTPQAGDQVFFYPADGIGGSSIQHTGLVVSVDNEYVYTVEGNVSGAVRQKKYERGYARFAGFGRPNYGMAVSANPAKPESPLPSPDTATNEAPDHFPDATKMVRIKASAANRKVNLRQGDGTSYARVAQVANGTELEYVATSPKGWHAVRYGQVIAWVSGNYAEVMNNVGS